MKLGQFYAIAGFLVVIILFAAYYFLASFPYYHILTDELTVLGALFAFFAICLEYKRSKKAGLPQALVFLLLALAFGLWALAETVWAYQEIVQGVREPQPSLADLFWVLGYAPYFYAVSVIYALLEPRAYLKAGLLIFISYIILSAAVFPYVGELVVGMENNFPVNALNAGYVLGEIAMLAIHVPLVYVFLTTRRSQGWMLLGLSRALSALAVLWFFESVATGEFEPGHVGYTFYILAYFFVGLSALVHGEEEKTPSTTRVRHAAGSRD
jgi:hypothetical protein